MGIPRVSFWDGSKPGQGKGRFPPDPPGPLPGGRVGAPLSFPVLECLLMRASSWWPSLPVPGPGPFRNMGQSRRSVSQQKRRPRGEPRWTHLMGRLVRAPASDAGAATFSQARPSGRHAELHGHPGRALPETEDAAGVQPAQWEGCVRWPLGTETHDEFNYRSGCRRKCIAYFHRILCV